MVQVPSYRLFKEKINQISSILSRKLSRDSTAYGTYADQYGNNIESTYVKKKDL